MSNLHTGNIKKKIFRKHRNDLIILAIRDLRNFVPRFNQKFSIRRSTKNEIYEILYTILKLIQKIYLHDLAEGHPSP